MVVFYLEQFSRTVNGIVDSLSEHKRKEKPSSKRVQELSSHQLNHVVTVIYKYCFFFYLEQFSRTVNGIVNSLSEHKRKEKPSSKQVQELSSHQLNHVVTVIENWKQDEEGLQVSYLIQGSHRLENT